MTPYQEKRFVSEQENNVHGHHTDGIVVSLIIPCFNEMNNIVPFYEEAIETFGSSPYRFELIFIDDGSTDETFKKISEVAESNKLDQFIIKGVRLSRNFGKESGIYTGLSEANGSIVGIIDADLQQSPADALAMINILVSDPEIDCVAAYQESRKESKLLRNLKKQFYRLFARSSGMNTIQDASDFRFFRKNVAQALLDMPERLRFFKGMSSWVGFKTVAYPYTPRERTAGESKWSTKKLFSYALEGILSFSTAPLKIATYLGIICAFCAIVYTIIIIADVLFRGVDVPGYATTMSVILLLGGAQLFCIGILGEYIARLFIEEKHRPISIIKSEVVSSNAQDVENDTKESYLD